MAKGPSKKSQDEKRVADHLKNRINDMFAEKGDFPAPSIREVDELKTRISELEARLAESEKPTHPRPAVEQAAPAAPARPVGRAPLARPKTAEPSAAQMKQRRILLVAIFIGVAVAFLAFFLYNLFGLQGGRMDPSDKGLLPVVSLMLVANLFSFWLIRRDRPELAMWLSYLVLVVIPPLGAVLLLLNVAIVAAGFVVIFALIYISAGFSRSSRLVASIVLAVELLLIFLIESLNPAWRMGSALLSTFAPIVAAVAVAGIIAFFVRQALEGNLRWKFVTAFLITSLLSIGLLGFVAQRSFSASLTSSLGRNLSEIANTKAIEIGQAVEREADLLQALAQNEALSNAAQEANQAGDLSPQEIEVLDQRWKAADAANTNATNLVAGVIYNPLADQLRRVQNQFPEQVEIFLTDQQGITLAATNRTSDYYQADEEWWRTAFEEGIFIGQPEFDASSKTLAIIIATAVRDHQTDQVVGVLRTTVDFSSLAQSLTSARFGRTGHADIYLPDGNALILEPASGGGFTLVLREADLPITTVAQAIGPYMEVAPKGIPAIGGQALLDPLDADQNSLAVRNLQWRIVVLQDREEAMQPVEEQTRTLLVLGAILSAGVILAAIFLAGLLSGPLLRLNAVAARIASGDLAAEARVETADEIGTLAATFNNMTAQLRDLFGSLEQRVLDRTHDLELASEVGRVVTGQVENLDELLTTAVELIRAKFNLYYTQLYLTDPSGRVLVLRAGTGEVAQALLERGHQLPISSASLNGRSALEKRAVIVPDTALSASFMPNPMLPKTRSEMAVPLIAGEQVIGVLDMQSEEPGSLNETNLTAFEALAGQLAIGIQNAALFGQAERSRLEMAEQVRQLTERGWSEYLDAIERGQQMGFSFDQQNITPLKPDELRKAASPDGLNEPITILGAEIGALELGLAPDRPWSQMDREVVQATALRLGQHVENLRLLNQAERYRYQAEQVARRLTREGWEAYTQTQLSQASRYEFDLTQVQPLPASGNGHQPPSEAATFPLVIRDEPIGKLAVEAGAQSDESREIIAAVAQQLSSHIENLRLTEQNLNRARQLETVADVSATTATLLDPDKLLQTVVDVAKQRFGVYHTHIYLADETWQTLLLAAGAGEVGRKMVAEEHAIDMGAERSLVARAARERKAAIVNNVRSDPAFLPNPLLPDTRSEMAVPLIAGDKVIGVFDVQSERENAFGDEDASIYTTLAAQVAIALQNARLYAAQAAHVTQLRELDRLKSSFLANMSHELRTPLNSILGFTDVMLEEIDGPLTENMSNDLQLIHKNGQHLLSLINNVLDMAKIEAGRMNLSPEKFKVNGVFEDVISISAPMAKDKSLDLYIDPQSDCETEILADRMRINQVMLNLVTNALKFTDQGSVCLSMVRQDEKVLISVRDSGVGIPPEQLEAVFQEFSQVDTSATRKVGGTGLGLPISRQLVGMHGGRMWAESTGIPGEGSVFYVELPLEAKFTQVEKVTR